MGHSGSERGAPLWHDGELGFCSGGTQKERKDFARENPASSDSTADIPGSKRKERGQKGVSGRQMGFLKLTAAVAVELSGTCVETTEVAVDVQVSDQAAPFFPSLSSLP